MQAIKVRGGRRRRPPGLKEISESLTFASSQATETRWPIVKAGIMRIVLVPHSPCSSIFPGGARFGRVFAVSQESDKSFTLDYPLDLQVSCPLAFLICPLFSGEWPERRIAHQWNPCPALSLVGGRISLHVLPLPSRPT